MLCTSRILLISSSSCSRKNLASNPVKDVFSKEDQMLSNVKDAHVKKNLDKKKMGYVLLQASDLFPVASTENDDKCWANCIKDIVSAS